MEFMILKGLLRKNETIHKLRFRMKQNEQSNKLLTSNLIPNLLIDDI